MSLVEVLLIAARVIHLAAAMVLFGEMLFARLFTPGDATGASSAAPGRGEPGRTEMRFLRVTVAAWAGLLLSGAAWLALVAAQMSGRSLAALDWPTIETVLGSTVFGRAWVLRAVLAVALAGMWPLLFAKSAPRRRWMLVASAVAGALLASLAWSGHANAQVGREGAIHHLSDSIHLLAAGTWLGGLAPLAALLRHADASPNRRAVAECANAVRRFGDAAALCVGALVVTGIVNACYLIPDPSSLFETGYGRLLLLKILAFVFMLAIAAVNRKRLTPAMNRGGPAGTGAALALRRNVFLEQALGAVVILLVAALGVSPPPMRM